MKQPSDGFDSTGLAQLFGVHSATNQTAPTPAPTTTQDSGHSGHTTNTPLIGGVIGGVRGAVVIAAVIGCICWRRRAKSRRAVVPEELVRKFEDSGPAKGDVAHYPPVELGNHGLHEMEQHTARVAELDPRGVSAEMGAGKERAELPGNV